TRRSSVVTARSPPSRAPRPSTRSSRMDKGRDSTPLFFFFFRSFLFSGSSLFSSGPLSFLSLCSVLCISPPPLSSSILFSSLLLLPPLLSSSLLSLPLLSPPLTSPLPFSPLSSSSTLLPTSLLSSLLLSSSFHSDSYKYVYCHGD